ncbi:VOC family protein [Hymenobacter taeanensis]|uniref:VOC family protein n=1 Tax=Hymenobacter taeanensis TaxID=2735321 RepID=A0A6M6BG62_9BACT|nr:MULTISPECIES: VOC family protein [Hymenobacter]QJX46969.1 VOC family protein [Hymenobacter taeanensis]UOQ80847.1 VOC family protein [Hymenobacter sp. 5414T-23]
MNALELIPYLSFNGTCREAMTFYQQCLGGELMIQAFEGTPAAEHMPEEARQGVMHAILKNEAFTLMASDAGMQKITQGNTISLSINCHSAEQIQQLFSQMSAGGTVTMALEDTFWGATFGMFTDQFGINWMLNYDKEPQP